VNQVVIECSYTSHARDNNQAKLAKSTYSIPDTLISIILL